LLLDIILVDVEVEIPRVRVGTYSRFNQRGLRIWRWLRANSSWRIQHAALGHMVNLAKLPAEVLTQVTKTNFPETLANPENVGLSVVVGSMYILHYHLQKTYRST